MVIGSVYSSFTPQPVIHIHSFTTLCFFHTLLAYPQRAIISNKSQWKIENLYRNVYGSIVGEYLYGGQYGAS